MALQVFRSIHDAKAAGFEPYDRAPQVFLYRRQRPPEDPKGPGWEMAVVQLTFAPDPKT